MTSLDDTDDVPMGVKIRTEVKDFCRSCWTLHTLKNKLPITKWLPKYQLRDLQCDAIAGITVALTVIPQGLAYAKIARLRPQYGLYSAFMGCFIYCLLGTSKDITIGPTAIMSLMTARFADSPIDFDPTYAIVLSLMCGIIQFLMGALHLGITVNFISHPVLNAFTSAAAVTIAFGQVKDILGLKNIPRDFLPQVYWTFHNIGETNVWDLVMGLSCMIILFFLKKLRTINWGDGNINIGIFQTICRKFLWLIGTGSNAVIVVSSALVAAAIESQFTGHKLTLTGELEQGLPPFEPPAFSETCGNVTITTGDIFSQLGVGLGIVPLLGLVETIAIGRVFAKQNNYKIDANQELVAIGVANICSSFVSAYPVTGSFSRTAVNSQSNVKTPASGIFTGSLVLLALAALTPLFYYIPTAALSAVIILAVLQMVDYKIVVSLWKLQKLDLLPLFVTFISSLIIGIEYGILVGIGLSLLLLLYPLARPRIQKHGDIIPVIEISHGLQFPAVEYLQEKVTEIAEGNCTGVILDCSHFFAIDYSTIQGVQELIVDLNRLNIAAVFLNLQPRILADLKRSEIDYFYTAKTIGEASRLIEDLSARPFHGSAGDSANAVEIERLLGNNVTKTYS